MDHELRLAADEIDTLLDALKAWENKDLSGEIMGEMIDMMLVDKLTRQSDQFKTERETRKAEAEAARRQRAETSVLLQAKLLRMRNSLDVDTFIAGALGPARS